MSGPLEREFALHTYIARLHTYIYTDGLVVTREDAKAALSAIERHVQDMATALEKIISLMSSSEESWEDPVQIARAALPAREKGEG